MLFRMQYLEAPSIQSVSRQHTYSPIKWISKAKFQEMLHSREQRDLIRPYLNGDYTDRVDNRVYVGRTSQSDNNEGVRNTYEYWCQKNRVPVNLDIIGSVVRNDLNDDWELHVSHGAQEIVIKSDFWVLVIEDETAYEWKQTQTVSRFTPFIKRFIS